MIALSLYHHDLPCFRQTGIYLSYPTLPSLYLWLTSYNWKGTTQQELMKR